MTIDRRTFAQGAWRPNRLINTRMAGMGFDGGTSTPAEFIQRRISAWGEMIRGARIEPE